MNFRCRERHLLFSPAQNRRIFAVRLLAQGKEMQYFNFGNGRDTGWRN